MSRPPKKPQAVADAEAALEAKWAEVVAARERLSSLEREHATAAAALTQARIEADAALPQCRVVRVGWRTSTEQDEWRAAILRRTPGGALVVRPVGQTDHEAEKFKWLPLSRRFVQAAKTSYATSTRELRDVPPEFMPEVAR